MIAETNGGDSNKPGSLKRSLFNKPAWSKPTHKLDDSVLFHRSNRVYSNLAVEVKQRKQAKKQREPACQTSVQGCAPKRMRMSDDDIDDDDSDDHDDDSDDHGYMTKCHGDADDKTEDQKPFIGDAIISTAKNTHAGISPRCANQASGSSEPSPLEKKKSLLHQYETKCAGNGGEGGKEHNFPQSGIIDLEEDEDLVGPETCEIRSTAQDLESDGVSRLDDVASDEEFPELARQARERARRKRLEESVPTQLSGHSFPNSKAFHSQQIQASNPPSSLDPVLQILITSSITNTEPLIVNRRLSQSLKDVRLAWVDRQRFTPEYADTIFLTWRGKRLFDVTSCKSLGIRVDEGGNVVSKNDIFGGLEGRIHMEAMTAEIFEACKAAKRNEINEVHQEKQDQATVVTANEKAEVTLEDEAQVRIILKAKGVDHFKLVVRPV